MAEPMEPGPSLDAEVAERVMGWRWAQDEGLNSAWWWDSERKPHSTDWSPSTDWRAAGEVKRKLMEMGYTVTVTTSINAEGQSIAGVLLRDAENKPRHSVMREDECHALSLAALAAAEEKT